MDALAEVLNDDAKRAEAAYRRANRAFWMAELTEGEHSARRAVALAEAALADIAVGPQSDDVHVGLYKLRLISLRLVGMTMMSPGRRDAARALLQQTLNEARERALLVPQVLCLSSLAALAHDRGDLVQSQELNREALATARQLGDRRGEAIALANVGAGSMGLGDLSAARRDMTEALRLNRLNGDRALVCGPLCNLSELALYEGDDARESGLAHGRRKDRVEAHTSRAAATAVLGCGRLAHATDEGDEHYEQRRHTKRKPAQWGVWRGASFGRRDAAHDCNAMGDTVCRDRPRRRHAR